MQDLIKKAKSVLEGNDRGQFTIPSGHLYPHMLAWDSAFAAMGWAHINHDRAMTELEYLLKSRWKNGMVPHISFDKNALTDYFPGPDVWKNDHGSTITQPPVWAEALEYILEKGADAERAKALLPQIEESHLFFYQERDPLEISQVAVSHPWESGMDNAPCWDSAMRRVSTSIETELKRVDKKKVEDTGQRPSDEEYLRYLRIVESLAKNDFTPTEFVVYDPMVTTVLALNEKALARLGKKLGYKTEAESRAKNLSDSLMASWDDSQNRAPYRDGLLDMDYFVPTLGSLYPILLDEFSSDKKEKVIEYIKSNHIGEFGFSTTDINSDVFDPKCYWRGPCRINTNWFFFKVMPEEAKSQIKKLIETSGFREYYQPMTGEGLGARNFSSSAALYLTLFDR